MENLRSKKNFFDVVSIGEMMIDFIEDYNPLEQTRTFKKCFGGAPANFAVGCSRLKLKTAFVSQVGDDEFGHFLTDTLKREGVDITQVKTSNAYKTGLAFVSRVVKVLKNNKTVDRKFLFYRENCADRFIDYFNPNYLKNSRYLFFGSISLIYPKSRSTVFRMLKTAEKNNINICFDPNIRLNLWENDTKKWVMKALKYPNVILLTGDELCFLTNQKNLKKAVEKIKRITSRVDIIGIKMGENGAMIFKDNKIEKIPAFKTRVVDTTGAGDAWNAGFLYGLIKGYDISKTGKIANLCGSLCVSKQGAISGLPKEKDILKILARIS